MSCNFDQIRRSIRSNNEDARVDSEILPITAAYIHAYCAIWQFFEEAFDYRPWLGVSDGFESERKR